MNYNIQVIIPFICYFIVIILIGISSSGFSSRGISEFFLGGRQMNRLVVALSSVVSGRSAWLLIGVTGMAYMNGLAAIWVIVGYIIIELLLFLYYAPKIREYTEKNDCITIPDFFAAKFKDHNNSLRIMIVFIFILFMVTYVSSQFVAGGKAFFANFSISPVSGLIITAGIVLVYTLLGGFLAVSLTDVVQAFIMIFALVGLPIFAIIQKGGWDEISGTLIQVDKDFLNITNLSFLTFIGYLGIGLGSPGNPHILVRYMSIKDPHQFKWSAVVGTIWNIFMGAGAIFIGVIGRSYFPQLCNLPDSDSENIYLSLANNLLHPVVIGILLASIFAAIMSTADSQLLVAASSVVRDIYEKILRKNKSVSKRGLTWLSKFTVVALVGLSVVLGIFVEDVVFWFVLFAWAGLGAAIGPTSILALFSKKVTKKGVMAGLISGTLTVFIWKSIPLLDEALYELIPGFLVSFLMTVIVSFLDIKMGMRK